MGEVRSAIRGLTPVAMEDNGLTTALEELVARTQENFHIPCRLASNRAVLIEDNRIATHLYCIAQEAVHNAVKHARAKEIVVSLKDQGDHVVLEVSDDGGGIPPEVDLGKSMGHRIHALAGREIDDGSHSGPIDGKGTRVTCTLPRGERDG